MFRFLKPTNNKFFEHFEGVADRIVRSAEICSAYLSAGGDPKPMAQKVKDLEHEADEITHAAMELLHQSFITPIDRGDIRRLVQCLDDVVDLIDSVANRLVLYEIREPLPAARSIGQVVVAAGGVVQQAVRALRHVRDREPILKLCIEIHRQENESDRLHHEALAQLFKSGMDALAVIKWKEILERLETAVDRCEDVANLVEGIVLENA